MTVKHTPMILALASALGACETAAFDWREDYNFAWHGEHISVYGYDLEQDDAFAGSLEFLDDYTRMMTESLGFTPTDPLTYHWMSADFFPGKCPPGYGACTAAGVPRSRIMPDMHELAHAVSYAKIGICPSVLEEGLAEYFSRPRFEFLPWSAEPTFDAEIDELLTGAPIGFSGYGRAGHFVAFLIETYGVEALVALCQSIPTNNELGHWEQAVEAVLGPTLPELLATYAAYPSCTKQQYRARLMECSGPIDLIISSDSTTDFSVIMNRDQPDIIGPIDGKMVAIRRVWVEQSTYAHVWILNQNHNVPPSAIASQECVPCSATPRLNGNVDPNLNFALREGRHAFLFYLPADRSDTFDVSITPLPGGP